MPAEQTSLPCPRPSAPLAPLPWLAILDCHRSNPLALPVDAAFPRHGHPARIWSPLHDKAWRLARPLSTVPAARAGSQATLQCAPLCPDAPTISTHGFSHVLGRQPDTASLGLPIPHLLASQLNFRGSTVESPPLEDRKFAVQQVTNKQTNCCILARERERRRGASHRRGRI